MRGKHRNLRKAALLVASLDAEHAREIFAQMSDEQVQASTPPSSALGEVDPDEQRDVIEEFFRIGPLVPDKNPSGIDLNGEVEAQSLRARAWPSRRRALVQLVPPDRWSSCTTPRRNARAAVRARASANRGDGRRTFAPRNRRRCPGRLSVGVAGQRRAVWSIWKRPTPKSCTRWSVALLPGSAPRAVRSSPLGRLRRFEQHSRRRQPASPPAHSEQPCASRSPLGRPR